MKYATEAELRAAIKRKCTQMTWGLLRDVCDSIASRCQQCLDQYLIYVSMAIICSMKGTLKPEVLNRGLNYYY